MFILFGTRGLTLTQQSGTFHCPHCGPQAPFSQKGVRRFFTLFFVPLIPLDQVSAFVECHRCRSQYDLNVLQWNPHGPAETVAAPGMMPALQHPGMRPVKGLVPSLPNATITHRSNGAATASMILGIIGLLTSVIFCPAIVLVPLGLVFGIVGLTSASRLGSGKGKAIAGLVCSIIGGIVMIVMISSFKDAGKNVAPKTAYETAKDRVNASTKATGLGNTEQAKAIAQMVASELQDMHDTLITDSHTADEYTVYCELHANTCAFLIFVPDYRRFEDDLKKEMEEACWSLARTTLQMSGAMKAADAEVAVGLKGLVLYGSVMTGRMNEENPKKKSSVDTDLPRFFPEKTVKAEAEVPSPKP